MKPSTTRTITFFVTVKSKHAKLLRGDPRIEQATVAISEGYLKFKDIHANTFKLELAPLVDEEAQFLAGSHVEYVRTRHVRGDRWAIEIRLTPRPRAEEGVEGVMGVDVGGNSVSSIVAVWTALGRTHIRRAPLHRRMEPAVFPDLARFLDSLIDAFKIRTVRFEGLDPEPDGTVMMHVSLNHFLRNHLQGRVGVELVSPRYTSQACPQCGQNNRDRPMSGYACIYCGHRNDRDVVAATNIQRGGVIPRVITGMAV